MTLTFKKLLTCVLVLLIVFTGYLMSTCDAASQKSGEEIFIEEGKVGEISTGMDLTNLIKKYPSRFKKTSVYREGDEIPSFVYTFNNKKSILLEVTNANVVLVIHINDPYFKTKKNMGVGNTFREVKNAYPEAEFYAGLEEGENISLNVKGFGFFFDTRGIKRDWFMQNEKDMSMIQDNKVVVIMMLH